ncbi:hypothetical protein SAMD00019534_034750 [Acytostelium subglobosum LB1]|uniref:hypothetical protein n=1 Tax=Acytostelium subglobosum LB1 TaxID=1410327 RepID=UPI000644FA58|nr:hypothetical protein SAMD00019534_034750 [Acytostelium subglobosum LB1]GAM20300.1 hypothetical protein SAMD00019534_034750 [Acytostelium subglobosum LB1]|eukprot:XP_012759821.1 hypothetical protein SAMD00019534_034750 [Acytostelium subglobosum LB1]
MEHEPQTQTYTEESNIGCSSSSISSAGSDASSSTIVGDSQPLKINNQQWHQLQVEADVGPSTASPSAVVVEGELVKQGHIFKSWRTRWFKIEASHLLYFKSKNDTEPIDRIPLRGSRVSKKPFHEKQFCFELMAVTMKKVFLLQAKNAKDVDYWMNELDRASQMASSSRSPSRSPSPSQSQPQSPILLSSTSSITNNQS